MRHWIVLAALCCLLSPPGAPAQPTIPAEPFHDGLRGTTPLDEEAKPPLIFPTENKDVIRGRAYAQQPPTIPHKIDGYQVDKNANRCLSCHARSRAAESGAVPIGVSHYSDRSGATLGSLAPRRYFCTQCHVPQADTKPLVGNTFTDIEDIRVAPGPKPAAARRN
ncbi:Nitrate reductase cytochrome c550-type subunit [Caballeronia glathei]|jgi:cytochrome c-type protein NapB|uniref:Periplasmic nitrate reductase, electron transfer subunit n=1 Tax=Caballeronia glathei TaxID=60547 RepID=A0A069PUP5_9BURK|nr:MULTISPECIES: nitrate reductase cytochrome c-type subunit [Burkholderiaceae]KDR41051.1 nitrate reductase [Caballeronia glathei]TCK44097.1 periplasmic nitrate reductase subunit NapB [Paraburkholderia sp. BL8N3]CDY73320.1 Nitrate reductase cytochrome c550-type subunit [Caballeronia glathei]